MNRVLFLLFAIGVLFTACQPDTNNAAESVATEKPNNTPSTELATKAMEDPGEVPPGADLIDRLTSGQQNNKELVAITTNLSRTMASAMLESVKLNNGKVTIKYFDSANAINQAMAGARQDMSEDIFKKYWNAASRAEKVVTDVPAELLKDFEALNSVEIILPTGTKTMKATVTRSELEKLTGKTWKEMKSDWNGQYKNQYVRIPEGRSKFLKQMVK